MRPTVLENSFHGSLCLGPLPQLWVLGWRYIVWRGDEGRAVPPWCLCGLNSASPWSLLWSEALDVLLAILHCILSAWEPASLQPQRSHQAVPVFCVTMWLSLRAVSRGVKPWAHHFSRWSWAVCCVNRPGGSLVPGVPLWFVGPAWCSQHALSFHHHSAHVPVCASQVGKYVLNP